MDAIEDRASEAFRMSTVAYEQGNRAYGDRLASEARNLRTSRDIKAYEGLGILISRGFEPGGTLRHWARPDD